MVSSNVLSVLPLFVSVFAGDKAWGNYCNTKVCNKCRSYLVRNYRVKEDRYWIMCSTLARNKFCCDFSHGPTLFTVGDFCRDQPSEKLVEVERVSINKDLNSTECDVIKNSADESQIKSELEEPFLKFEQLVSNDVSQLCCDEKAQNCQNGSCLIIESEAKKLANKTKDGRRSELMMKDGCEMEYVEYLPCAVVNTNQQSDKLQEIAVYVGLVFVGALIGACMIAIIVWKRRDTQRLEIQQKVRSNPQTTLHSRVSSDYRLSENKETEALKSYHPQNL